MVNRRSWQEELETAWRRRSVVWLAGVRRVGKTCLARSMDGIEYFDCELPRVRQAMEDPEAFLSELRGKRIVLDETHRLSNPSELLKIAADHFPTVRVLATGSSMLGAAAKFSDTLAGRKAELWLTPMTLADLADFRRPNLRHRLHHGGLPPFFLSPEPPEKDFQEWIDAYWAKDIQELFRLERRHSFQKFLELLLASSGGLFEASRFAAPCEVSRTTIGNYLQVLSETFVVHVIRPFSSRRANEILAAPKVYGFDTGFVAAHRGWRELRPEDLGVLWEHFVLNELQSATQSRDLRYWRDKQGHEIDFVWARRRHPPLAIECKWSAKSADLANLAVFFRAYPEALGFVVTPDADPGFTRECEGRPVRFVTLLQLAALLASSGKQVAQA